ncbi:phospholipase D family protein [Oceanomicrobium pacificus]|uniref:Phospholipase D n=1 Tax=Oceanomicrobium pacificus TaxID=2692916 RepID=A0A6B0TSH3_9RHOB|nr:phospholipase D-like domain-containing protein [Oceanomicrobium pacificus]MXU65689.1 phospholipase [Oceanomicrobium pacificus]
MPEDGQGGGAGTRLLLTAAEAFPAFEELVLDAQDRVVMGFRVFDPDTRLRSERAQEVGRTWGDLIGATLDRGVSVRLILSDFDAVARPELHRGTHAAIRKLNAIAEGSAHPDLWTGIAALHPARVGIGPRLLFWPKILGELKATAERLNALDPDERSQALEDMPGVAAYLRKDGGTLRPRRWPVPPLVPASHHQKLAVIDGRTLYIGGLDLDERRYDTPAHDRGSRQTWHDAQVIVEGEAAAAAEAHLEAFPEECERGSTLPRPGLLRTLSAQRSNAQFHVSPKPVVSELTDAHLSGIEAAQKLVYLETQFFRCRKIAQALAEAAHRAPDIGMVLVLPAAPEDVAFEGKTKSDARYGEYLQAKCVDQVRAAFGDRLFIGAPAQHRRESADPDAKGRAALDEAPIVYVHAKLSVFDGASAIVSSANLNGRSLDWDTEAGVELGAPDAARLLDRCLDHWVGGELAAELPRDGALAPALARISQEDAERPPETRRSLLLPYPVAPARRFGRNIPGLPEEIV